MSNGVLELMRHLGRPVPMMRRRRVDGDHTLVSDLPEPEPRGRWRKRSSALTLARRDFSGAAMSGGTLAVVTLYRGREGGLLIDTERSILMALDGRNQSTVEAFYHQTQLFFFENGIKNVHVRSPMEKGPLSASANIYKIEAILQLLDMVTAELVHPVSLTNWVQRERPDLPTLEKGLSSSERSAKTYAIETAAYVESAGTSLSSARFLQELLNG